MMKIKQNDKMINYLILPFTISHLTSDKGVCEMEQSKDER